MIIGIDGNEANVEKKVGIGEYSYELIKEFYNLQNSAGANLIHPKGGNLRFQVYLKNEPSKEMPIGHEGWKYIILGPHKLWTQIGLPLYLYTHFPRPDVFFSPTHYAPRFSPVKTAISIMDLSFLKYPELFKKKDLYQLVNWTKYSVKNASKIFTISNTSKGDIINEYSKAPQDIVVTYPGIKGELESMNNELSKEDLKVKYGISENYILFVGTIQPRKNIVRLVEAFARLRGPVTPHPHSTASVASLPAGGQWGTPSRATPSNLELIIVGKKGWLYEEILASPRKFEVEDFVKFLDFVPEEDLPSFYKNALCFILPSLYEGFGLPVLEAMKYGCPVITSNVSSLPEAGGNAAIYVDPESVDDIAEKMQKVISDKKLRESMIKKGYTHIKKFSWEKAAKDTLNVILELGEGK